MALITEKEITAKIRQAESSAADKDQKASDIKKFMERAHFLRTCLNYIRTGPSEEYLTKELARLADMVKKRDDVYEPPKNAANLMQAVLKQHRKEHDDKYETVKIRLQLETVRFLLQAD